MEVISTKKSKVLEDIQNPIVHINLHPNTLIEHTIKKSQGKIYLQHNCN